MRWSRAFIPTLKEAPSDAVSPSHKLLVRGGFIRQVASGIYEFLPLGLKVLKKIENIVREEMNRAGAQEVLLTVLNPRELWEETGRWELYGEELFKLKDRHGRDFCLGPTHEEEITDLVRKEVKSYKDLPLILYQIQTKFRDEKRPRFGLIRAREFLMKDAYSFDTNYEDAQKSYELMGQAYERIFRRIGLKFLRVLADTGQIGGKKSEEFVALTPYGEAKVAYCESCGYSANAEIVSLSKPPVEEEEEKPLQKVETPNTRTIEELAKFLKTKPEKILKSLLYIVEGKPVLVLIRGDREVDENKLERLLGTDNFRLADDGEIKEILGTERGFVGILNLPPNRVERIIWDNSLYGVKNLVVASNEPHYHYINANPGRDFEYGEFYDLAEVKEDDPCPECGKPLKLSRGLEIGHIFLLGTRYSEPMKAYFVDKDGKEKPIVMGCYGIGVSRLMSAIVEQSHDENGIIWHPNVAPFELEILPLNVSDEIQKQTAEKLYKQALERGIDVIIDDRDERAGFKFKDADLIGIPIRIVVGRKAKDGLVEIQIRKTGEKIDVPVDSALDKFEEIKKKLLEG
ncbi:MAG: proline--tRNA ligase [Aquificaceae bacterium]|nr:MAG: proline--tRNA ligase [Aquificaceae bacterium]